MATLPSWASSAVFSEEKMIKTLEVLPLALKEVAPLWRQLGLHLGLNPGSLDDIKSNPGKDSMQEKFESMLRHWHDKGDDEYRTWGALAKAVDNSGNRALGNEVRKLKHYQESSRAEMDLKELTTFLAGLTASWKTFATFLGIHIDVVDKIEQKLKANDCFRSVIIKWIRDPDDGEKPTFEVLCKALKSPAVANCALANKISKDVEVLQLLVVPEETTDKENVEKELRCHIAGLKEQIDGIEAEVAALPNPPQTIPEKKSAEKQQEEPNKEVQDPEKQKHYDDERRRVWERKQQEHDEKNAERLAKNEKPKGSSPP